MKQARVANSYDQINESLDLTKKTKILYVVSANSSPASHTK